jgi:hypothetical protein
LLLSPSSEQHVLESSRFLSNQDFHKKICILVTNDLYHGDEKRTLGMCAQIPSADIFFSPAPANLDVTVLFGIFSLQTLRFQYFAARKVDSILGNPFATTS